MDETKKQGGGLKMLSAALVVVVLIGGTGVSCYNSLQSGEVAVQNSIASIDAQLCRRNDLIPQVISTLESSDARGEKAIAAITDARIRMMGAVDMDEKIAADEELSDAIKQLELIAESYPKLKTDESFLAIRDELAGAESSMGAARKDYNEAVMDYNRKLRSFPSTLVAKIFGFEKYNAFTASPDNTALRDGGAASAG